MDKDDVKCVEVAFAIGTPFIAAQPTITDRVPMGVASIRSTIIACPNCRLFAVKAFSHIAYSYLTLRLIL